jgi:hypothetical protein
LSDGYDGGQFEVSHSTSFRHQYFLPTPLDLSNTQVLIEQNKKYSSLDLCSFDLVGLSSSNNGSNNNNNNNNFINFNNNNNNSNNNNKNNNGESQSISVLGGGGGGGGCVVVDGSNGGELLNTPLPCHVVPNDNGLPSQPRPLDWPIAKNPCSISVSDMERLKQLKFLNDNLLIFHYSQTMNRVIARWNGEDNEKLYEKVVIDWLNKQISKRKVNLKLLLEWGIIKKRDDKKEAPGTRNGDGLDRLSPYVVEYVPSQYLHPLTLSPKLTESFPFVSRSTFRYSEKYVFCSVCIIILLIIFCLFIISFFFFFFWN